MRKIIFIISFFLVIVGVYFHQQNSPYLIKSDSYDLTFQNKVSPTPHNSLTNQSPTQQMPNTGNQNESEKSIEDDEKIRMLNELSAFQMSNKDLNEASDYSENSDNLNINYPNNNEDEQDRSPADENDYGEMNED